MAWNDEYEYMEREKLEKLQIERLQRVAQKVYDQVPYYRGALDEKGIKPGDIKSLEDLQKLLHVKQRKRKKSSIKSLMLLWEGDLQFFWLCFYLM